MAPDALVAFGAAFGLVFIAEFADKTQVMLVALAARGQALRTWLGAVAAFLVLSAAAALVGGLLGGLLAPRVVALAGGILFIVFGLLALRGEEDEEGLVRRAGFLPAFVLILVAELGDKTQLATAALAAQGHPAAVGLGAFLALAALLAVLAGGWLAARCRPSWCGASGRPCSS